MEDSRVCNQRIRRLVAHLQVSPEEEGLSCGVALRETAASKKKAPAAKQKKKKNSPLVPLAQVPAGTELLEPPVATLPEGKCDCF